MKIRMENDYSNGHHSERIFETATEPTVDPADEQDLRLGDLDWWEDVVWDETGDGTGQDDSLGFCYTATIVEANNSLLVGLEKEWIG